MNVKSAARQALNELLDEAEIQDLQREELLAMRDYDGHTRLDDRDIAEFAALPRVLYEEKVREIRTCYHRDRSAIRPRPAPKSDLTPELVTKAVAIGSRKGITFDAALAEIRSGQ